MADSFDDEEPPDGRPTIFRVVEGLTVVAFIIAVIVWQSDGTLTAAKRLAASWGFGETGEPANGAPPSSGDVRIAGGASDLPDFDAMATGSIAPEAPPLAISPDEAPPLAASPSISVPAASAAAGWLAACDGGSPSFCTASQSLSSPAEPTLETSWTIEKGSDGVVAIWTTPTDVAVSRGMTLSLGGGPAKTVPFDSCGPHSCEVRARLAADFLADLRRAGTAKTEIFLRDGRAVSFEFSANGLAAALDRLGV